MNDEYLVVDRSVWGGERGASRAIRTLSSLLPEDSTVLLDADRPRSPAWLALTSYVWGRSIHGSLRRPKGVRLVVILSSTLDMLGVLPLKLLGRDVRIIAPIFHLVPWRPNPEPLSLRLPKFLVQRSACALAMLTFDTLLTETSYIAEKIHRWNPRVQVIRESPGVASEWIPAALPPLDPATRDIDVLFLGAMKMSKGIGDALRAWRGISASIPGRRFVLAGYADAADERYVRERLRVESLRNVVVCPNVGEGEKFDLLRRAKVVIVPSYMEGIPFVFYEAMAYGAFLVAYDLPTYVDVRNRILPVPIGNVDALSKKVAEILSIYPNHAPGLADGNFQFVLQHEFTNIMRQVVEAISPHDGGA